MWLVLVPAAVLLAGAWQRRWMADDAFIHLRVVEQVLHGNGPVFNAGERVEASTSPLWVLVLAIVSAPRVIGLEAAAVGLGVLSTVGGLLLATWAADRLWRSPTGNRPLLLPVGAVILAVLPPMWDFATSGLETGFGFLWLGASFALLSGFVGPGVRWSLIRVTAVAAGLGPLIRPEFAVFSVAFLFAIVSLGRSAVGVPRRPWLHVLVAGLALPTAYEVFRMGYYAALVPNTAFAKEASRAWWSQGFRYFGDFVGTYWLWVPLLAALVLVASPLRNVAAAEKRRLVLLAAPVLGGVVHALYITRVGGDFMHGRLLLPGLFAVLMPVMVVPVRGARQWLAAAVVFVWAVVCAGQLRVAYVMTADGRSDERRFYTAGTRTSNPIAAADFVQHPFHEDGREARRLYRAGERRLGWRPDYRRPEFASIPLRPDLPFATAFSSYYVGVMGFVAGPEIHVIDRLGLGDRVAARLAVTSRGRPGHEKELPLAWVLGRAADPGAPLPEGVTREEMDAARSAMACGSLGELEAAVTGDLTPGRFVRNLGLSLRLHSFRVDPDPVMAARRLCRR